MSQGATYVFFGKPALREVTLSVQSLRGHMRLDVAYLGDANLKGCSRRDVRFAPGRLSNAQLARWAKVSLYDWSPFEYTLFLDADTRVLQDISVGFEILKQGWELVIVTSANQHLYSPLWILSERERRITFNELGDSNPTMLNSGVMFFRKSERLGRFFEQWKKEWLRFKDKDQGALLRALHHCPVAVWLLGRPFNGGEAVEHNFGRAAR